MVARGRYWAEAFRIRRSRGRRSGRLGRSIDLIPKLVKFINLPFAATTFLLFATRTVAAQPTDAASGHRARLKQVAEIVLDPTGGVAVSFPVAVAVDSRGDLCWSQYGDPVLVFDSTGTSRARVGSIGEGPGQYLGADLLTTDGEGNCVLFDGRLRKLISFRRSTIVDERRVAVEPALGFAVEANGQEYFLRKYDAGADSGAVLILDSRSKPVGERGPIPDAILLSRGLPGGGIGIGSSGTVFYSYMADHRIWSFRPESPTSNVIDKRPPYFVSVDTEEVKRIRQEYDRTRSVTPTIRYAARVSRVEKLFVTDTDLVIQSIATGVPRLDSPAEYYVEIFTADGDHVGKSLTVPGPVVAASSDRIFVYDGSKVSDEQNPSLLVFEIVR